MTEFPDRDLLAVGSLQLFAGVDESFSVLRCSWHPKYFPSKIGQRSLLALFFHPLIAPSTRNTFSHKPNYVVPLG